MFPERHPLFAVQAYLLGKKKHSCLFDHGGTKLSGHGCNESKMHNCESLAHKPMPEYYI